MVKIVFPSLCELHSVVKGHVKLVYTAVIVSSHVFESGWQFYITYRLRDMDCGTIMTIFKVQVICTTKRSDHLVFLHLLLVQADKVNHEVATKSYGNQRRTLRFTTCISK